MLNHFINIRKKLNNVAIQKTEIEGELTLTENDISILKTLAENDILEDFALVDSKNVPVNDLVPGQLAKIKLYSNRIKKQNYFETFDELLKYSNQKYPTEHFYVNSLNFDSNSTVEKPKQILSFEAITKLIALLTEFSDYQKNNELVFFQTKPLVIIIDYKESNLNSIINIDKLSEHILNSTDKEERKIIFLNELAASLLKIPNSDNRFIFLLDNFEGIFNDYLKSHMLYLQNFSYQKIKSEIDKEILDYSKRIQSVINDAQSKFVAIPAAFLIIISQFDLTGEKEFYNLVLFISAIVFSVLLELLLRNQFAALNFITDDVNRFKDSIDPKKIQTIGNQDFDSTFLKIHKLYLKQKKYLMIIRLIIWSTPIIAFCLFIQTITKEYIYGLVVFLLKFIIEVLL